MSRKIAAATVFVDNNILGYLYTVNNNNQNPELVEKKRKVCLLIEKLIKDKYRLQIPSIVYSEFYAIKDAAIYELKIRNLFRVCAYNQGAAKIFGDIFRLGKNPPQEKIEKVGGKKRYKAILKADSLILANSIDAGGSYFITDNIKDFLDFKEYAFENNLKILSIDDAISEFEVIEFLQPSLFHQNH